MKSIEIVTHCWAGRYAHYAHALRYQLCSLVMACPKNIEAKITVCCTPDDKATHAVLDHFIKLLPNMFVMQMPLPELGRRSIGRNKAALSTKADYVWFTDCDHVFGSGCLDAVPEVCWPKWAAMIYPQSIQIHQDHITGDGALELAEQHVMPSIQPEEFKSKRYHKAIGGVQIVCGNFAREYGYLKDSKRWQTPYHGDRGFDSCKCDKAYRRFITDMGRSIIPVNLPNLYRLRHSETTHHD